MQSFSVSHESTPTVRSLHWKIFALAFIVVAVANANGPQHSTQELTIVVEEKLKPSEMAREEGFGYTCRLHLNRGADSDARSMCILLENGKPLAQAHAAHAEIRAKGQGRYSHWTKTGIYLSSSDNSDPRTNGREYRLVSRRLIKRHRYANVVNQPRSMYVIPVAATNAVVNRQLSLKNLDQQSIIVPNVRERGSIDLSSVNGIVNGILKPGMSDEEKSLAIWKFLIDWRYHYYPAEGGDEIHDPLKFINVYGYGFCDDCAENFAILCQHVGIRARAYGLSGHVVGEAFYDGAWHMFDPDHEACYRRPDGKVASVEDLALHPEIITKTPFDPIGSDSKSIADLYTSQADNRPYEKRLRPTPTMEMRLQPGDEVVFPFNGPGTVRQIAFPSEEPPPVFGVGRLIRSLRFPSDANEMSVDLDWPFVLLGSELSATFRQPSANLDLTRRLPNGSFEPVVGIRQQQRWKADIGAGWTKRKTALYSYSIRIGSNEAALGQVAEQALLTTHFQFAPRTIVQAKPGGIAVDVELKTGDGKALAEGLGLEITHEWDEIVGEEAIP